jgi:hypothetical protein
MARFREIYNGAVADYRRSHKVRSRTHPVPDLETDDEWNEAPFWMWRRDDPRRRRLFVRQTAKQLLLSDRKHDDVRLSLDDRSFIDAAETLARLEEQGVKLRTRALLTTMWARLVLGDLFLHGIGGAKYDQVTDQVIRQFFQVEPLGYMAVTATLRLPIDRPRVSRQQLLGVEQALRQLNYHPERFIDRSAPPADLAVADVEGLIAQKQRSIAVMPTRETARQRTREIRSVNEALQPVLVPVRQRLMAQRDELAKLLHAHQILASREYSFCLHPRQSLQKIMLEFLANTS